MMVRATVDPAAQTKIAGAPPLTASIPMRTKSNGFRGSCGRDDGAFAITFLLDGRAVQAAAMYLPRFVESTSRTAINSSAPAKSHGHATIANVGEVVLASQSIAWAEVYSLQRLRGRRFVRLGHAFVLPLTQFA